MRKRLKLLVRSALDFFNLCWIIDEANIIWDFIRDFGVPPEKFNGDLDSIRNRFGDTPLHAMARYSPEFVIKHRSCASVFDGNGDTPLHLMAFFGHHESLRHKSFLSVKNRHGRTPYDLWISGGHRRLTCSEIIDIISQ